MDLQPGEQVVVETTWGQGLTRVLATFPAYPARTKGSLKNVLRRATPEDLATGGQIRMLELEAKAFCSRKIK